MEKTNHIKWLCESYEKVIESEDFSRFLTIILDKIEKKKPWTYNKDTILGYFKFNNLINCSDDLKACLMRFLKDNDVIEIANELINSWFILWNLTHNDKNKNWNDIIVEIFFKKTWVNRIVTYIKNILTYNLWWLSNEFWMDYVKSYLSKLNLWVWFINFIDFNTWIIIWDNWICQISKAHKSLYLIKKNNIDVLKSENEEVVNEWLIIIEKAWENKYLEFHKIDIEKGEIISSQNLDVWTYLWSNYLDDNIYLIVWNKWFQKIDTRTGISILKVHFLDLRFGISYEYNDKEIFIEFKSVNWDNYKITYDMNTWHTLSF